MNNSDIPWVKVKASNCPTNGLLLVGRDIDKSPIYAGRALHNNDFLPAKVIPSHRKAYVAYDGKEIVKEDIEVLMQFNVQWIPSSNGRVPKNAIPIGKTSVGEVLYFGRVRHDDGAITPGKVHPSHKCCYYPFAGQERCSTGYEIMTFKK